MSIPTILSAIAGFLDRVPWQVWAAIGLIIAAVIWGNHRYDDGREEERAAWEEKVAEIRAERDEAMKLATDMDKALAAAGIATIEDRRKELDDATADIPDQELTPRQRARACAELQRQGRGCEAPSAAS
jgi:hypothetical protein|tara:strand:+ start:43551 stop:43937 length:387 start_codon:yes stop_codon:yes gene_type:complete